MSRCFVKASSRDIFSLKAMKTIPNSKQVTKDTNKNYYAASLFLDKVLDGHLVAYAQNTFGSTVNKEQGNCLLMLVPLFHWLISIKLISYKI